MANQLTMDKVFGTRALYQAERSDRQIDRELCIRRETVDRHLQLAGADSEPAGNLYIGSSDPSRPTTKPTDHEAAQRVGDCGYIGSLCP